MIDTNLRETLLELKKLKDIKCDVPGFRGNLEPHQRVGVAFATLASNSLNLDFVGAGKTWEAIATDLKLRERGEVRRTLVVCQGGKRRDWRDEYSNLTDLPLYIIDGTKADRVNGWLAGQATDGVTIAHYEAVRGDFLERQELPPERGRKKQHRYVPSALLGYLRWDLVVFDEVSLFKTYESALADSLRYLRAQVPHARVLGLSATPVEKTYEDIHSIMEKIEPGLLPGRLAFIERYCIMQLFESYSGGRRHKYNKIIGYKNEEELAWLLAPYYIRREKQEVYGPDKLVHRPKIRRVQLTPSQAKKYKEVQGSATDGLARGSMLQKFLEMEKTCDTMAWFEGTDTSSAKIDDLRFLLLNDLREEKVVIFSKHHKPLEEVVARILLPEDIKYILYTGRVTDLAEREAGRHRFLNDPSVKVALITTAAEKAYNFHAAHYMVFLNHVYNPSRIEQIIGRIDRPIVQKSNFICSIHYVCEDTFEEKIVPRLQKEAGLMAKLFGATNKFDAFQGDMVEQLTNDQLLNLIKTGDLHVNQQTFARDG